MPKRTDRRRGQTPRPTPPPAGELLSPATRAGFADELPLLAAALRSAPDRAAMLTALGPFLRRPLREQIGLASALGRQADQDAADVAEALAALATDHAVAKEARRATIRLRTAGARPAIVVAPVETPLAPPAAPVSEAPRFVGAWASRSRETSEVALVMAWARSGPGDELDSYRFDLDFWNGTVNEASVLKPQTLRRLERDALPAMAQEESTRYVPVTIEQARALIDEALAQQAWRGAPLPGDWPQFEALLRRRLWRDDIPPDLTADAALINPDAEPDEVVVTFWSAWAFGDFALVYDLLSERGAIRERETRADFIALRRTWFDEAQPTRLRLGGIQTQTQEQSGLWVPTSGLGAGRSNWQFFWSLELRESPIAGQMPEYPLAIDTEPETGRHWFWQTVTLERADGWRIARIRDDGALAQARPLDELIARADELWQQAQTVANEGQGLTDQDAQRQHAQRVVAIVQEALATAEAALPRLPADRAFHDKLLDRMGEVGAWDRAAALLRRMLARFADHAAVQRTLCAIAYRQAQALAGADDEEGYLRWQAQAQAAARAAVDLERTPESLTMLAEMLSVQGNDEEAESLLRESLALTPTFGAWADLGEALMQRKHYLDAINAFEQAQKLDPASLEIRLRLGRALDLADRPDEARLAFEDVLTQQPDNPRAHALLGLVLHAQKAYAAARDHLYAAINGGVYSPQLLVSLAEIELRDGHEDRAKILLEQAAQLDPSLAPTIRQVFAPLFEKPPKRDRR